MNALVSASGIEDPENLTIDIEQMLQEQQMAQEQAMLAQAAGGVPQEAIEGEVIQDPSQMPIAPEVAPQEVVFPEQPQMSEEDAQIEQGLRAFGATEQQIAEAFQLLDEGVSGEEIFQALVGGVNG